MQMTGKSTFVRETRIHGWFAQLDGLIEISQSFPVKNDKIIVIYNRIILHQNRYWNRLKSSKSVIIRLKIKNILRNRFRLGLKLYIFEYNQRQNRFRRIFLIFNRIITDFEDFNRFQYRFWCRIIRL